MVVVEDGIATGPTARIACQVAGRLGASWVVVAVPVAPPQTAGDLTEAVAVVSLLTPHPFAAVGAH